MPDHWGDAGLGSDTDSTAASFARKGTNAGPSIHFAILFFSYWQRKESLQLTCERAGVSWVEFGVNGKEDANSRKMQSRAVLQRLFSEGKLDRAQLQRMHNHVVFHIATAQLHGIVECVCVCVFSLFLTCLIFLCSLASDPKLRVLRRRLALCFAGNVEIMGF